MVEDAKSHRMCRDFFFFFCFLSILCKPVWICWGFCLFFLILQFNSTCPPLPKKERKLINRTDWQTTLSSPRDMLCLRPCTPTQLCSVILSIAPLGLSCYVQTIEIRLNIHHTKIEETEDITLDISIWFSRVMKLSFSLYLTWSLDSQNNSTCVSKSGMGRNHNNV